MTEQISYIINPLKRNPQEETLAFVKTRPCNNGLVIAYIDGNKTEYAHNITIKKDGPFSYSADTVYISKNNKSKAKISSKKYMYLFNKQKCLEKIIKDVVPKEHSEGYSGCTFNIII